MRVSIFRRIVSTSLRGSFPRTISLFIITLSMGVEVVPFAPLLRIGDNKRLCSRILDSGVMLPLWCN
ncbi:hypothetical protein F2Q68_00025395 [Brassica cretica]|uniref:Uncharacterized protein n=1 Tax=Brassica cretica TaxID=69181 RepID=A0A8S9ICL4_BRACR|nr:hypothetical protein F2Q68_00025395 [Brassica cretica]